MTLPPGLCRTLGRFLRWLSTTICDQESLRPSGVTLTKNVFTVVGGRVEVNFRQPLLEDRYTNKAAPLIWSFARQKNNPGWVLYGSPGEGTGAVHEIRYTSVRDGSRDE